MSTFVCWECKSREAKKSREATKTKKTTGRSLFIGQFFFTFSNKKEWEKKNARAIILLQPTRFWVINLHSQRFAEINFVVDMRGHFFSVRRLLVYLLSFLGLEAKCVKRNFYNFTKNRLPLALVLVPGLGYKSPCK